MDPAAPSAIPPVSARVLARSDLPDLANFRDTSGHAVSFFFTLQSIPDKSHHTEVILVRDLVREELHEIDTRKAPGLAEDMEAVLMQARRFAKIRGIGGFRMRAIGRDSGGSLNCLRRNRSGSCMWAGGFCWPRCSGR